MIPVYLRCVLCAREGLQGKGKAQATQRTIFSRSSDWAAEEASKTLRSAQPLSETFCFDLTKGELKNMDKIKTLVLQNMSFPIKKKISGKFQQLHQRGSYLMEANPSSNVQADYAAYRGASAKPNSSHACVLPKERVLWQSIWYPPLSWAQAKQLHVEDLPSSRRHL